MYRRLICVVLALMILTACGGSVQSTTANATSAPAAAAVSEEALTESAAEAPAGGVSAPAAEPVQDRDDRAVPPRGEEGDAQRNQAAAPLGRMVIRNATLSLQVDKVDEAERNVRALVQNVGGYILDSSMTGTEDQRSIRLVFKIPSARFDDTLNELERLAGKVQSRSVSGQDVTEEFVDIESRLRNLRATEARLLEFLTQAETVEEALLVNEQLTALQAQIEQASGRITFLRENVAYSTINVDLQPPVTFALTPAEGWQPGVVAGRAWQAMLQFVQALANVGIALAIWSPVWGLLIFAGLLIWRRIDRRAPPPQPGAQP